MRTPDVAVDPSSCPAIRRLLEEFPEDERFDADEIEQHLATCPRCSALFPRLFPEVLAMMGVSLPTGQALATTAPAMTTPAMTSPAVTCLAETRLAETAPTARIGSHPLRRVAALIAAGLLVAAAIGLIRHRPTTTTGLPLVAQITGADQTGEVEPDTPPDLIRNNKHGALARERLALDTTTRWTQVSYSRGRPMRSTLETTVTRPNRRIRATFTR